MCLHSTVPITYVYGDRTYTGFIGNNLSIYAGTDDDGDGVGDASFTEGTMTDYHPLVSPIDDYLVISNVKGDFNGDGAVDIGDVAKVAYMVVGKADADPAADFNENGAVDIGDAARIAYYFIGKIEAL